MIHLFKMLPFFRLHSDITRKNKIGSILADIVIRNSTKGVSSRCCRKDNKWIIAGESHGYYENFRTKRHQCGS